jgi:enterochelin esterase family protein
MTDIPRPHGSLYRALLGAGSVALSMLAVSACSTSPGAGSAGTGTNAGGTGNSGESPSGMSQATAGSGLASGAASGAVGSTGTTISSGDRVAAGSGDGSPAPDASLGDAQTPAQDTGAPETSGTGDTDAQSVTLTDPGTEGDGDFTIGPAYSPDPLNNAQSGVPVGHQILFQMPISTQSAFYTGLAGSFTRNVLVYVPQQYVPGSPAPFLVVQDGVPRGQTGANGIGQVWLGRWNAAPPNVGPNLAATANIPNILDNLIATKMVPTVVAIFVDSGPGDYIGSERGLEYDTVSGKFGDFVETEVLPLVVTAVKSQLGIQLQLTSDPQGRATLGLSSGGAASFGMVWWHPEYFTRVITYSGTFVSATANTTFPHGAWVYHDVDPYNATTPNGLVVQHCAGAPAGCAAAIGQAACAAVSGCTWDMGTRPLRMWLEAAQHDNGAGSGPYGDFLLANQRMALALKGKGYHYHYDYALGVGHADGNVIAQTLPAALAWVWRGYPIP